MIVYTLKSRPDVDNFPKAFDSQLQFGYPTPKCGFTDYELVKLSSFISSGHLHEGQQYD